MALKDRMRYEAERSTVEQISSSLRLFLRMPIYGIVCQSVLPPTVRAMPTRNVVITDHQADFIEHLVDSGRYQNASEVLREGLRKVETEEKEARARFKALREAVRVGIADVDAGRYRTFESPEQISRHLAGVTAKVIANKGRAGKAAR